MLIRTALVLLLLLPAAASAQKLDTAVSAVVRISGTRNGDHLWGSGFVVGLDRDKATIVTASHVIEGAQVEVIFAADPTDRFPADAVLGMDPGVPNGLAVFQVRGALPAGVTTLSFEVESRPSLDDELFLVGFPQMERSPRIRRRRLSGWDGTLMLIDEAISESFSGGPVLQGGKVIGVVTSTQGQTTYAVSSVVAHVALEGWRVKLGGSNGTSMTTTAPLPKPAVPAPKPCAPGEESTEDGIIWVRICAGTFTMGSAENDAQALADEKPALQVTLSEFWIGKTEITNEQYRRFDSKHQGDAGLPTTQISWTEAKAACEHFGGRLPTEAEWEYAARADSKSAWSFGDDEKRLDEYAWYNKNSADHTPHPVGTKKANDWGLKDMLGNVLEWVADWYAPTYQSGPQLDPSGPKAGEQRVLRGGAFNDSPRNLRSAIRIKYWPQFGDGYFGFRCVRGPRRQP